jgi:(R)-2-hydroxyacyl-CoA dehydratese activating ATPase
MYLGIDIGSRFIKQVVLDDSGIKDIEVVETGYNPHERALCLVRKHNAKKIVATGYGRHFARDDFASAVITEIKAHAIGAHDRFPDCRTIVDIGGQDSKVISVGEDGRVIDFQMNDRCAAGTGKFLEIMARTLGYSLDDFGASATKAEKPVKVNSMCTVFAESEVISLLAKKENAENIGLGLHLSIVERISSMLYRIGVNDEVVMTGGVGRNICIKQLLSEKLGKHVYVPELPEIMGALGAALEAQNI